MPKLVTLTANTGLDLLLEVDSLDLGGVTRARSSREFPAGKGINVARAALALGVRAVCLGFAGRDELSRFERLEGLEARLTPVAGPTRTNVTLRDRGAGRTTHVIGVGYGVSAADLETLEVGARAVLEEGDVAALSGSWPPGAGEEASGRAVDWCREAGARAVLDSSGPFLREGLRAGPYAVKPNLEELAGLLGWRPDPASPGEVARAALQTSALGASLVVVSLGAHGALALDREERSAWRAWAGLPAGAGCGDAVGCGDALVAGLAVGLLRGLPLPELLALAVACGTASLLEPGPGACTAAGVERLLRAMRVEEVTFP
jgi:1-phosphofructokinase family hexose kinase